MVRLLFPYALFGLLLAVVGLVLLIACANLASFLLASSEVAREDAEQARQRLALLREGPRAETIAAQRSLVAQSRAQLTLAEATLAKAVISAPFGPPYCSRPRSRGR